MITHFTHLQKKRMRTEEEFLDKNYSHKEKTGHVLFSPSSMSIWNTCPKAFWLEQNIIKSDAMQGLAGSGEMIHDELHQLWINKLKTNQASKQALKMFNKIKKIYENKHKFNFIEPEITLKSSLIPGLEGTADLVGIINTSFTDTNIYIVDYKSSERFQYKALNNLQTMSYGLMAAEKRGINKFKLITIIIQPTCSAKSAIYTSTQKLTKTISTIKKNILEDKRRYSYKCDNPFCPYHTKLKEFKTFDMLCKK